MSPGVYHRLREQLDQYSFGFPATQSGVEIKILKKLCTEKEAEIFLYLTLKPQEPEAIAREIDEDPQEMGKLLDTMADKGLIFRLRKGGSARYGAVPFVMGSYEFQLKDMDRELAELFEQYLNDALAQNFVSQRGLLRTIPVNQSIDVSWPIAPYEDVRRIIKSMNRIAVAKCICRVQQGLLGEACGKPVETCFMFNAHADYYVERGMARWLSVEESLKIIDRCEEAGLVPQPYDSQSPGGMCNCCGDCCAMLRALRHHPRPSEIVTSNYYASPVPELCTGCGICLDRCQVDAITIDDSDGCAVVDLDRCIGCGLCVTTCEAEAMRLYLKPEKERFGPPTTAWETMVRMATERKKSLVPLVTEKKSKQQS